VQRQEATLKNFTLGRDMLNLRGQFYPTGHIVAMFPDAQAAQAAARALADAGVPDADIALITPEVMMRDIVRTVGNTDLPLPSAGTEADTVRRYSQYAAQGHHALLIPTPDSENDERLMQVLKDHGVSHAQKYRMLVIEDLA
jgi:hypothetical protein